MNTKGFKQQNTEVDINGLMHTLSAGGSGDNRTTGWLSKFPAVGRNLE